jgi:hypothetical protein
LTRLLRTRQISRDSVLFIFPFHGVQRLEPLRRALIAIGKRPGILLDLDNTAHDLPAVSVLQPGDFRNDFRPAHICNVNSLRWIGKFDPHAIIHQNTAAEVKAGLLNRALLQLPVHPAVPPAACTKSLGSVTFFP